MSDRFRCWAAAWAVAAGLAMTAAAADVQEDFEGVRAGPVADLAATHGRWTAVPGQAEIHGEHAHGGRQSLRLLGGADREVVWALAEPLAQPARLAFHSERWTKNPPFAFRVDAAAAGGSWREVLVADDVKTGGFLTRPEVSLPTGTQRVRFRSTSPDGSGVMIDDLSLASETPMRVVDATTVRPACPVLVRKAVNPVLGINIRTAGSLKPLMLHSLEVSFEGTTTPADIVESALATGGADASGPFDVSGSGFRATRQGQIVKLSNAKALQAGDNWFWVVVRLRDGADIDGRIAAAVENVSLSGTTVRLKAEGGDPQRIGVAVRVRNDDGSDTYRIPGLVRTKAGSLVSAYDIRYRGGADLPADIDVGTSRSTDGGRTWEPMRIALDMGREPRFASDGVGDPCIFTDRETGRLFVAALWSHGARGWNGSGPGMTPDETGQLMMTTSDDDGRSWSPPRNLTPQLKDPSWRLLLAGPGTGITIRDGTLVFPAQFRDAEGIPHSTLAWSKDHGESWHIGTGAKSKTTESQLVELADGSIMINCRDDRGGSRTVAVTRDLGKTWEPHPSDRRLLPESVCMASLLAIDVPKAGRRLFFSNPATTAGRHTMTIKVSADEGLSWPDERHMLYDRRNGLGYSCLAPVDDAHVGVLYEGLAELYFVRFPVAELIGP